MAQKLTITIPDKLSGRLKAVRDRFNISRVCARAIAVQVLKQELRKQELQDMDKVIERLKQEKKEYTKNNQQDGHLEGLQCAKTMSYEELYELVMACEVYGRDLHPQHFPDIVRNASCWRDWFAERFDEMKEEGPIDETAFLIGWLEGVLDFWKEVVSKL